MKLDRMFYEQNTLEVAKQLLGKILVHKIDSHIYQAMITETESYMGFDDKASHASRGVTPRTKIMYGPAGFAYVYLIYGMYYCLNIVTEKDGYPAAVLIRSLDYPNANGPGKLCREFEISKDQNGLDVTGDKLWIDDRGYQPQKINTAKRIGVDYAGKSADLPWRFWINMS